MIEVIQIRQQNLQSLLLLPLQKKEKGHINNKDRAASRANI